LAKFLKSAKFKCLVVFKHIVLKMICKFVTIIALLCLVVTFVHTAPQTQPARQSRFEVVSERFHQDPNLEYSFEQQFQTGEKFNEDGTLKNVSGMDVIVTKGSYTIINPDGSETIVNYTADETGFHPEIITPNTGRVN